MNSNPLVTLRKYRDFRRLWLSAVVSDVGTWMQAVTVTVLVATTSNSAASTALIYSMLFLPQAVCAPLGGLLADRFDRRNVAIVVQVVQAVLAGVLALMVHQGITSVGALSLMVAALGCVNAVGQPAYAAMIPLLVPRSDLYPAVSLNAVSWNTGRILGPILAALVANLWGWEASAIIAANAVSFLVMAAVLFTIRRPLSGGGHVDLRQVRSELVAAARLMWRTPALRLGMAAVTLMQATASTMFSLVPLYAKAVGGTGRSAQVLYSAIGLGALLSALATSGLARHFGRARVLTFMLVSTAALMIVASTLQVMALAVPVAFAFGATSIPAFVLVGGMVQREAPEQFRGRITSLQVALVGLVFGVMAPLSGFLADQLWGLRTQLAVSGAVLGTVVLVTALSRPRLGALVDGSDPPPRRVELREARAAA